MIATSQVCALLAAVVLLSPCWGLPLERPAADNGLSQSHEAARTLWNNARKLHRRLSRPQKREVGNPSQVYDQSDSLRSLLNDTAALNITAPKYMLELYSQLSNPLRIANMQANTIRTLQVAPREPVCGEFNFSISSINSSELVLEAELHLFLEAPSKSSRYLAFIKLFEPLEDGRYVATTKEVITVEDESRWHVFNVDEVLHNWVRNGESNAVFKVQILHYNDDYTLSGPLACDADEASFVYTDEDKDTEPFLVVYSYDDEVEKVNYGRILNELERETIASPTVASPSVSTTTDLRRTSQLSKRDVTPIDSSDPRPPTCNVQELNVTAADLNRIHVVRGEVYLPLSYNAGICGGQCGSKFPRGPQHASLIHILLNQGTFNDRHGYSFSQCCAPVRYVPLDTLTRTGYEYRINIIQNMRIMQCECLDVIDYSRRR